MADTTTVMALPFPEGADANDVPADMQALAERLDEAPGIESLTSAKISGLAAGEKPAGRVVYNSTTSKLQVSNGSTFADVDAAALLKAGGTMAGNIAMGNNKVTGLAAASSNGDAVRYEQALLLAGGTMAGNINANGNKVTGLAAASTNGDAVRYEQYAALGVYSGWTPTLTADSSNPTATASPDLCRYARIGNKVTGTGFVEVTGSGTGNYRIPLPVAPKAAGSAGVMIGKVTMFGNDGTLSAMEYTLYKAPSQNYCYGRETYSSPAAVNHLDHITYAAVTGTKYLTWQFDYEAA